MNAKEGGATKIGPQVSKDRPMDPAKHAALLFSQAYKLGIRTASLHTEEGWRFFLLNCTEVQIDGEGLKLSWGRESDDGLRQVSIQPSHQRYGLDLEIKVFMAKRDARITITHRIEGITTAEMRKRNNQPALYLQEEGGRHSAEISLDEITYGSPEGVFRYVRCEEGPDLNSI